MIRDEHLRDEQGELLARMVRHVGALLDWVGRDGQGAVVHLADRAIKGEDDEARTVRVGEFDAHQPPPARSRIICAFASSTAFLTIGTRFGSGFASGATVRLRTCW